MTTPERAVYGSGKEATMPRPNGIWWLCGMLLAAAGCANRMEIQALKNFDAAMIAQNKDGRQIEQLREATSEDFEKKALRIDDSVEDLRILRVPTGKAEIVAVDDVSDTEKIVSAKVGDAQKKVRYRLVKDTATKKWVVDDIYLKQKHDGVESTKSVTEQMDLLLSVREFLRAWDSGDRTKALQSTAPKLRETLDAVPPAHFARIADLVVGPKKESSRMRPEAQMDDNIAIVKVVRPVGQLILTYELVDGVWLVTDAAVEAKEEADHIPSVSKYAIALTTAVEFLRAYEAEDRETLARVSSPKFYKGGLEPADLKSIPLPSGEAPMPDQKFRMAAKRAEMILPSDTELVKLSLVREEAADADSAVRYFVEDVTMYDNATREEKRLSSMFTAQAMLTVFCDALSERDLPTLRKTSTADFNRRVWDRLKQSGPAGSVPYASTNSHTTIDDLPLGEIPPEAPQVVAKKFQGAVTEIKVRQGEEELTYILRESGGQVRVDDILMPTANRPKSLKETTELIVPLREFAAALELRDMGLVQRASSVDYNRLVWRQTDRLPELSSSALRFLRAQVSAIDAREDSVVITLGDERWGAKVTLSKEHSQLVVDDVLLVAGLAESERVKLKLAMRQELAQGGIVHDTFDERTAMRAEGVINTHYEVDADAPRGGGLPTGGFKIEPRPRGAMIRLPVKRAAGKPVEDPEADLLPRAQRRETRPPKMPRALPPIDEADPIGENSLDTELTPPEPSDDAFQSPPADLATDAPALESHNERRASDRRLHRSVISPAPRRTSLR